MSTPKRIQRKRTKGWRMPEGAVYVGRPSIWGNPYRVEKVKKGVWFVTLGSDLRLTVFSRLGTEASGVAVDRFRAMLASLARDGLRYPDNGAIRAELRGHDLACWCPLEDEDGLRYPCHADVLLEIANVEDGA